MNEKVSVLQVDNLSIAFSMYNRGLSKRDLEVIHELSIDVKKGEIVAVVGSSGSGKSLLAHAIMGILPENSKTKGSIKYYNDELNEKYLRKVRGKDIAFIPQSVDFLDPLIVAKNVAETDNRKYITIDDFANELRDGKNGVDGIGAMGKKSIIII